MKIEQIFVCFSKSPHFKNSSFNAVLLYTLFQLFNAIFLNTKIALFQIFFFNSRKSALWAFINNKYPSYKTVFPRPKKLR